MQGQRTVSRVPGGHWRRLTILGAIACDDLAAGITIAVASSTAVLLAFTEQVPISALHSRPETLVAMDNLAPHRAAAVQTALRRAGLLHRHLPAYSIDLSPIELAWSKLKARLRAVAPPTIATLEYALPSARDAITSNEARV
ncbi:transposase [Dankookia rubra]|uniref:transposase n=1 Tax=Dankookia rubra TaxID=1442381 RepID=UPI001F4F23F7|nr:transposase [Dankookia rubra]